MTLPDDLWPLPAVEAEEPAPRTLLLRVRGEFDEAVGMELAGVLDEELDGCGATRILLDLSRVTLLAPEALGVLRRLRRRCRVEHRHLVLVGTGHPLVHRPLLTSGELALFDIRANVQAALSGQSSSGRGPVGRVPRPAARS
jgi:anti-anti-sigma factor